MQMLIVKRLVQQL